MTVKDQFADFLMFSANGVKSAVRKPDTLLLTVATFYHTSDNNLINTSSLHLKKGRSPLTRGSSPYSNMSTEPQYELSQSNITNISTSGVVGTKCFFNHK